MIKFTYKIKMKLDFLKIGKVITYGWIYMGEFYSL
jgi:hypothetical protein